MRLFPLAILLLGLAGGVALSAVDATTTTDPQGFSRLVQRVVGSFFRHMSPSDLEAVMTAREFADLSPGQIASLVADFVQPADLAPYQDIRSVAYKTATGYRYDLLVGADGLLNPRLRTYIRFVWLAVRGARGGDPVHYRSAMVEVYAKLSNDLNFDALETFAATASPT